MKFELTKTECQLLWSALLTHKDFCTDIYNKYLDHEPIDMTPENLVSRRDHWQSKLTDIKNLMKKIYPQIY